MRTGVGQAAEVRGAHGAPYGLAQPTASLNRDRPVKKHAVFSIIRIFS